MKALFSGPKRFLNWNPSARQITVLIILIVFAGTLVLRHLGWLQFLEFHHYDFFVRQQPKADAVGPIVLVEMTESDIQRLDYPMRDDELAGLLRRLEAQQPAAIGLDIWRDLPVPRNGTGLPQLNAVFTNFHNLVAIFTLNGIAPPPVLVGEPHRIAFNDNFPVDVGVDYTTPKVRRTLLFAPGPGGEIYDSLPYSLALMYLLHEGIEEREDPADPQALILGKATFKPLQSDDGPYVDAEQGGFQMLLDFRCPEDFIRYTFNDVLTDAIPADALRNKIVLVGINAPSVSDERVTPIQRDLRGIELQAMTVNQLLRRARDGDPALSFLAEWQEALYMLLWCAIGGIVGLGIRSTWVFAPITVVCLLALPVLGWVTFNAGKWIPIVTPGVGFVVTTALVVSFASYRERLMRNVLMKLYSRHVSKEIAESIWQERDSFLDGHRPLAQKLTATVLFTDLKGFSSISETMEPSDLYAWLNVYLGAMAKVIQDHGGVLKQFTGDGILVLFGVPVPRRTREEQARDAIAGVKCAVAMGRRLVAMVRQWGKSRLPVVGMRAGIHTGEVAAGSVGSDDRFEYALVGDVVNIASRLESYDKAFADPELLPNRCRILVGAPTIELLDGAFPAREIGLIEVKGKATKVSVYQILDEAVVEEGTSITTLSTENSRAAR